MSKEKIAFTDFLQIANKLEIKVGMVKSAVRVPKKDKLLELTVVFEIPLNDKSTPTKICVTNLGEFYEPEKFIGCRLPFIMNLEPAKMGGVVSEVMLMVGKGNGDIKIDLRDFEFGDELM